MKKPKIAFFEIESWEIDYLKSQLKGFDLIFFEDKLSLENLNKIKDVNILSPFIYSTIDKKVINFLKS